MEFSYVSLLCFFVFLTTLLLYFFFYATKSGLSNLPPGKIGWPIIGETLEYLSCGKNGQPEKFSFDRIAKYSSNVFKTHLFGEKAVFFCGPLGNKFLFLNEEKLVQAWWPRSFDKIFHPSNEITSREIAIQLKKIFPRFLNSEALRGYVGVMDDIARKHFASSWENRDQVEVYPLSESYTFWVAARLFLGVEDPTEASKLFELFMVLPAGMFSVPIDLPGTALNKAVKASSQLRKQFLAIIKQKKIDLADGKASPTQDVMSIMLNATDEHGNFFNESDVADKMLGLVVGGHATSSSVSTSIVKYLAELPEIYEGVYKEQMEIAKSKAPGELLSWEDIKKMKYSWNVVREALRLAPPAPGAFREALSDFIFHGFSIPKGRKLYWDANATHKNPEYFPDPLKFDPSRFEGSGPAPYTFIPFGGGPRICPGKEYAQLVILVFIHNLVIIW